MCQYSDEEISRLAARLATWPSNGKPEMDDDVHLLIACGFVEEKEQMKACRECGTPRVDFRWLRITQAGKLFLAAARKCLES
jgi:hypothetical protein